MDSNKILEADILDIVFDGRNKEYGAYDLRKTYSRRMGIALGIMLTVALLVFVGVILSNTLEKNKQAVVEIKDVTLEDVEEKKNEPPPPPPPPKLPEPPKVEIAKFTPPKIVKDEEVKEDEKPPEQEKLDDAKIGTINQEGIKDEGIVAPPVEKGTGEVVTPKVDTEDYDKVFTKVENPAEFPGGQDAWRRYLERSLQYPEAAQENGIQGVVRVQFIVDKEGNISEVQALNNPGEGLAEEAVRIIKKGPKWKPAEQNGRKVIYRHIQSITFKLE
ncbi:MAG: TonB family protein [Bacteroidota bacterium]